MYYSAFAVYIHIKWWSFSNKPMHTRTSRTNSHCQRARTNAQATNIVWKMSIAWHGMGREWNGMERNGLNCEKRFRTAYTCTFQNDTNCSKKYYKIWIFSCFCARWSVGAGDALRHIGNGLVSPQVSVLLLKINRMYRSITLIIEMQPLLLSFRFDR